MKKVLSVIILIFLICSINCKAFAADGNIWEQSKEWIELGRSQQGNTTIGYTGFENLAGILTAIGIWVILISGSVLGIKFMISDPEKRAELKQALMIYAIGSVIILGALGIWKAVISIFDIF